jgi:alkylation response protein AidB-like acyl-CoA dehydrogenase
VASHALAELLERARIKRLTRHQHVLFRIGELIACVEGAGALARRAAAAVAGDLPEKADGRFSADALACVSRVFARETAAKIAAEGMRWALGADGVDASERPAFEAAMGLASLHEAQAGLIDDMDGVAKALYDALDG